MSLARFAAIPAGDFLMGADDGYANERPVHRVFVDAFAMAVYPVTQAEYAGFLAATDHAPPREWPHPFVAGPAPLPVTGVSWLDAADYCAWRTARGEPVRLPTEAEWERAARGGVDGQRYAALSSDGNGDEVPAWIPAGGRGPLAGPWEVTRGEPNPFGLYGIGANVHEWCSDWYADDYYAVSPARNPQGPPSGQRKASRGGAWRHATTLSRVAARSRIDPSFRYTDYGFRVVRAL